MALFKFMKNTLIQFMVPFNISNSLCTLFNYSYEGIQITFFIKDTSWRIRFIFSYFSLIVSLIAVKNPKPKILDYRLLTLISQVYADISVFLLWEKICIYLEILVRKFYNKPQQKQYSGLYQEEKLERSRDTLSP